MKKTIIVIIVLVLIGLAYYFITKPAAVTPLPAAPVTSDVQPSPADTAMPNMTMPLPATQTPAALSHTVAVVSNTSVTSSKAAIVIKNFAFVPTPVTVKIGTVVTWTNDDSIAHTVTSDSGTLLQSPAIAPGSTFSFTFTTPGTYTYHCTIHPSMKGTIVVTS